MAEPKVHKKEQPNKAEPTPQAKKAQAYRASGMSLREIAEKLNIQRRQVEVLLEVGIPATSVEKKESKKSAKGK